jgi:p-aminobenzoyl-glutamate transporter AbgT
MTPASIAGFLSHMVETYTGFHPLGVVLVALLGVGVAERSGFLNAILKSMLNVTPRALLTPMLIFVAVVSHTAADAGYVLVIPIGGVMFYAAGRHPLAGIAAAFAGVSGGFSANFIPSGIDPLLSGLTQEAVAIVDGTRGVNPLCNWAFTSASCLIIVGLGWFLTDFVIEPRLKGTVVDGDPAEMPSMAQVTPVEKRALRVALIALGLAIVGLFAWAYPTSSALRDKFGSLTNYKTDLVSAGMTFEENSLSVASIEPKGAARLAGIQIGDTVTSVAGVAISNPDDWSRELAKLKAGKASPINVSRGGESLTLSLVPDKQTIPGAPLILSIVPLIFLLFVIPGIAYGYTAGTFKNHRDVVKGMSKTMETMGYYLVLVFFTALFIEAFSISNIGKLLAIKGANFLRDSHAPPPVTILGIILFTALINLLVGSASAKWAMLSPIFVPMLMYLGISPELTQAAYRVGDSTTNIITPMMPYFPLVVVFCQKYVTNTGIGTVASMMLPYSVTFLVCWAIFLLGYWQLGIPLGIDAPYTYEVAR